MTIARWFAATFFAICFSLHLEFPPSYAAYIGYVVAFFVGLAALGFALASRPVDRRSLLWLLLGLCLNFVRGTFFLLLAAIGIRFNDHPIETAVGFGDVIVRTAIVWGPLAVVAAGHFWRRSGPAFRDPLFTLLLGLRLMACATGPVALLALGTNALFAILVFAPMVPVAWYSARLAWEARGDARLPFLRRYGRLFAVIGANTLLFVAAVATGQLGGSNTSSYAAHPGWNLLRFSAMGIHFSALALIYIAISLTLFKRSTTP